MNQLRKLPSAARRGGFAFVNISRRAFVPVSAATRFVGRSLRRCATSLRRAQVPVMVVSLVVLSYFLGYVNGLSAFSEPTTTIDSAVPDSADHGTAATAEQEVRSGDADKEREEAQRVDMPSPSGSSVRVAVLPIDGEVVSGPDWVKDPASGDWTYSYEVLLESRTSGIVRSALPGVIASVTKDGDTWSVKVEHSDGTVISYSRLVEADVGPGLAVVRGQRIGLATETESGFRVALNALDNGEPCSAMDLIR